jgi:hypothetical protein
MSQSVMRKPLNQVSAKSLADNQEKPADTNSVTFEQKRDAADYVAALVMELRMIADNAGLEKIVPPLEKAYYEAFSVIRELHLSAASKHFENPASAHNGTD